MPFKSPISLALSAIVLGTSLLHAADKPNVILILADDLGWGDLGCYGHAKFKTPNIDRLASEGTRLTDFYAPVPFCAPTRAALMTGRYPFRCGLSTNPVPKADPQVKTADDFGLPPDEVTLAEALKKHDYATALLGKWHLGHQPRFYPTRQGFDRFFGLLYSNDMHPVELFDGDRRIEYPVVQTTLIKRMTDHALGFIEENESKPFFLYYASPMPHKPLAAGEEFYKKSGNGLYADVIAELDWSVGQILDKLRELDLERNTLVVFTSDNGPWYGGSAGPLRGMKGNITEGGIRVPFIARLPGVIPSGRTSGEPAIMMDVHPTVLNLCAVAPAGRKLDGRDLLPVLKGGGPSQHVAIFFFRGQQLCAVRAGKWKLHLCPSGADPARAVRRSESWVDPRGPDGVRILAPDEQARPSEYPGLLTGDVWMETALFDLEKDPGEQQNVIDKEPAVMKQLMTAVEDFRADIQSVRARTPNEPAK
jgi:uncharacterized sulfatase